MSTAPDLLRFASDDAFNSEFTQAIHAAGMTGKKAEILELLEHIEVHGLPVAHASLRGRTTKAEIDEREFNPGSQPSLFLCEQADLQVAVARALAFDQALPGWSISGREQRRLHWTAGDAWMFNLTDQSGRTRKSWSDLDEDLLRKAIELWKPGGKLATSRSASFSDTARMMVAVGRYVHHSEGVLAFKRAGVDLNLFAEWVVDPKYPDSVENDRLWIKDISKKQPIPGAMLAHNNIRAATALVSSWTSPEARNVARQIVDACASRDSTFGIPAQLLKTIQNDRQHNADDTSAKDEALGFLNALDHLHPSPNGTAGKLMLLDRVIALQIRRGEQRDQDFVHAVLQSPAGFAEIIVRDLLKAQSPTDWNAAVTQAAAGLAVTAVQAHHHELLASCQALATFISDPAPGTRNLVIRAAGDINPDMSFRSEDFAATLNFLSSAGVDLWTPVDRPGQLTANNRPKTTSLLHELAESRTGHYADALVVALELGADPELKDHAGRRASNLIDDPARREHWKSIVRSHVARAAAHDILEEILPQGVKP